LSLLEHTGRQALSVDAGEIVSVLGAPGSGKSHLALELAFLARPRDGEVLFRGANPLARGRGRQTQRPRQVTMLVQNAEEQLFARTVFDDVAFGPRHLLLDDAEIERRVLEALVAVRLDPAVVRDRSPFALSGGERRRVALAGVLAMEPEVLILDEPTSNLDPRTRADFIELLHPLRGRAAIVWFTANAVEASQASRIYVLQDGETHEVKSGGELMHDWRRLAAAGIDLPAVYELAGALERRGATLTEAASPSEMREAIVRDWRVRRDR